MSPASLAVPALGAASLLLAWGYFLRYPISRPPIGVFSLGDVVVMLVGVVVVLGPLMLIQDAWSIRHRGAERTTWQYLQAEPRPT